MDLENKINTSQVSMQPTDISVRETVGTGIMWKMCMKNKVKKRC
jgi:hypothetical protein